MLAHLHRCQLLTQPNLGEGGVARKVLQDRCRPSWQSPRGLRNALTDRRPDRPPRRRGLEASISFTSLRPPPRASQVLEAVRNVSEGLRKPWETLRNFAAKCLEASGILDERTMNERCSKTRCSRVLFIHLSFIKISGSFQKLCAKLRKVSQGLRKLSGIFLTAYGPRDGPGKETPTGEGIPTPQVVLHVQLPEPPRERRVSQEH